MIKEERESEVKSIEEHHYYLFHQDFNNESCSNAIRFILERNLMDPLPKYMKIIFNSPGGDLSAAFSLIDVMKASKVPIHTYGLGVIGSCGLFAFVSGKKGFRFISENTSILSHQFSWYAYGKQHELIATQKEVNNTSKRLLDHYIKCTGLSEKDVKKFLLPPEDVWLTAKEAVKYGIADEICKFY